jgi:hypothetical protein
LTQQAYPGIPEYHVAGLFLTFTEQAKKISHEYRAQLLITSAQPFGLYKEYLWSHIDLLLPIVINNSDEVFVWFWHVSCSNTT